MKELTSKLIDLGASVGSKIFFALVTLIIGSIIIKGLMKLLSRSNVLQKAEGTARSLILSFIKIVLYLLLVISIIGILGVPMASIAALLASAGVAIGLALQGALSNLAGGIMLMIFKPFKVGDYVELAGAAGTVREVTLFYTILRTVDNKKVTVPNGSLMNSNITDYSSESTRRVDLSITCAKGEPVQKVKDIIMDAVRSHESVLADPEPSARLDSGTDEAMLYSGKVWCDNGNYWNVYYDLNESITEALRENGIKLPAVHIVPER